MGKINRISSNIGCYQALDATPPTPYQVYEVIRTKHYAYSTDSTETKYVQWIRRYIPFHHKRHPKEKSRSLSAPSDRQ
ncbi:phage integrase N-terminal SAM-like domain-containing protein [Acaryochloris sp. IP29b_bin.148]|uniref:phage integrase N-terminal SAM-like domain-containing protein n=1 Tax=Acaryochloris sp. IP29b_bin.148 TaxID=2969218 RepID=UPI0034550221